jgi:hypothetical protein
VVKGRRQAIKSFKVKPSKAQERTRVARAEAEAIEKEKRPVSNMPGII